MSNKFVVTNDKSITELSVQHWLESFEQNIQPTLFELKSFYDGTDNISKLRTDNRRADNNTTVDANFVVQIYNCF